MPLIPVEKRLSRILLHICRRQLENRPTTLRQLSICMGIGVDVIKAILEENKVDYLIISHLQKNTNFGKEILISYIPDHLYEELSYYKINYYGYMPTGITAERILDSYHEAVRITQPKIPLGTLKVPNTKEIILLSNERNADLYYGRRINDRQFEIMEEGLIKAKEVKRIAREKGYGADAITIMFNKRVKHPRPIWTPYVYKGRNYYEKEVLDYLEDIETTYITEIWLEKSRARRAKIAEEQKIADKTVSTK